MRACWFLAFLILDLATVFAAHSAYSEAIHVEAGGDDVVDDENGNDKDFIGEDRAALSSMLKALDSDGDGKISLEEFMSTFGKNMSEKFREADEDNDGFLTVAEFEALIASLDEKEAQLSSILEELDSDGDGKLSLEEVMPADSVAVTEDKKALAVKFQDADVDKDGYLAGDELEPFIWQD